MPKGSCLCGGVTFEVADISGPVEICHCNRCRKKSGTGSITMVGVDAGQFSYLTGTDLITSYAAPVLYRPPPYHSYFCRNCGSPLPPPGMSTGFMEIPIGLFDDDPGVNPDKHIYIDFIPEWDRVTDDLPQFTVKEIYEARHDGKLPDNFKPRSHYDTQP